MSAARPLAKRKAGRPRSAAARSAILKAARALLDEHHPSLLTIEAVARRAGVGKPTIYRSWANAQELAMAALMDADPHGADAAVEKGLAAFKSLIDKTVARLNSKRGRQIAITLAGAEPDGELFKAFANRVVLEGRRRGLEILKAEQARGALKRSADLEAAVDMAFGAIFLRLLLRHAPLSAETGEEAMKILVHGLKAKS